MKNNNNVQFTDEQLNTILKPLIDDFLSKTSKAGKPMTFKKTQLIKKLDLQLGFVEPTKRNQFVDHVIENVFKDRVKITLANVYSDTMLQIKYFNDSLLENLINTKPNKNGKVEITFSIDKELINSIVPNENGKLFVEDKKEQLRLLSINWTNETLRKQQRIAEPSEK